MDSTPGSLPDTPPYSYSDSPSSMDSHVSPIDGGYELHDVLGSGGMGIVYRAWQPQLQRFVAVKQLHYYLPRGDNRATDSVARFQREMRALGKVRHKHLIRIYDSGVSIDNCLFYTMELIEGRSLAEIHRTLSEQDTGDVPVWLAACRHDFCETETETETETECDAPSANESYERIVVDLICQVAEAVDALHSVDIVHRDIKPGNIMINRQGDHATLMDLSHAFLLSDGDSFQLTRTSVIPGTLPYISPEQLNGQTVSPAWDVYNIGAVLWEMLTLRRLFDGASTSAPETLMHRILEEEPESICEIRATVPPELDGIVLKCLAKQPQQRYANVQELIADLQRWKNGRPVLAPLRRELQKKIARRRVLICLLVAVLLVAVPGLLALSWSYMNESKVAPRTASLSIPNSSRQAANAARFIESGLVGRWTAEGAGMTVLDASGLGNHGRLIGNTMRRPGPFGQAYYFGGKGDFISFGNDEFWDFLHQGKPFSISGFLLHYKEGEKTHPGILSTVDAISGGAERSGIVVQISYWNKLELRIQGHAYDATKGESAPVRLQSRNAVPIGIFTPFAVTFDGRTATVYLNGIASGTQELQAPCASGEESSDALTFGSVGAGTAGNNAPVAFLYGALDEIQIYDRALGSDEIAWLAGVTDDTPKLRNDRTQR